jgi:hypothetical protein
VIYKISFARGCQFYKGHFYYIGQKVKLNVDKLIDEYKGHNQLYGQQYIDEMEEIRNNVFTIDSISSYYPSCSLKEFWHFLDLDDLILIKNGG